VISHVEKDGLLAFVCPISFSKLCRLFWRKRKCVFHYVIRGLKLATGREYRKQKEGCLLVASAYSSLIIISNLRTSKNLLIS
jgi:hypothetical protein